MNDENSNGAVDNRQIFGRDNEENSNEDYKTNSQDDDIQMSNKQYNSIEHDGVHSEKSDEIYSIAGTENNDSAMAPTVELSTSLSCSSADIYEQSTSNGDSGFDMARNDHAEAGACSLQGEEGSNADAATNMGGTKASIDLIDSDESTSGKTPKILSRKNYKNRSYRNRGPYVSSSDDDDDVEMNKVKHSKTNEGSSSAPSAFSTVTGEQVSSEDTIIRDIASSSQNLGPLVEYERSEMVSPLALNENAVAGGGFEDEYEMAATPATSSGNEDDAASWDVTSPVNGPGGESEADGEDSTAPPSSSENAEMTSEGSELAFPLNQSYNRMLFISSSSNSDGSNSDGMNDSTIDSEQVKALHDVLNKPKPSYTWYSTYELMQREHGLRGIGRSSLRNGISYGFNSRFYASRHVVERMMCSHHLRKHVGCVNCLNFNRSGDLLCTGSDDTRIIVWDWARSLIKLNHISGHTANIFQAKFLNCNNSGGFNIITAGRDRDVRHSIIPPSGGGVESVSLYRHRGPVHKLVLCPQTPQEIISVGEDGFIRQYDLRESPETSNALRLVKVNDKKIRLFGISHHPFKQEIVVCGCDRYIRVYDKRQMDEAVYEMCPKHLLNTSVPQVTCCVYNSTGSEVLATYSDDHIYLFGNEAYKKGDFLHQYRGHYNNKTIKGVNFFGPNSEYVISGSDCGNIFIWDKNNEAILNCMPGDAIGVVNCLETHPSVPIMATSGLDHNVKIWAPYAPSYPPVMARLPERVKRNLKRTLSDKGAAVANRQFNYFIRQLLGHSNTGDSESQNDSSSSSDDATDYAQADHVNCSTQ